MSKDPLLDIVRSLDLTGGVFLEARFTAPWAIAAHVSAEDCKPFMDMPSQVIAFHVVTKGRLFLQIDGMPVREVSEGEIILLPKNEWHTLMSDEGVAPEIGDDLILPPVDGGLPRIDFGNGGELTRVLCGFLASNSGSNPLIDTLPRAISLPVEDLASLEWVEASMRIAARELSGGRIASSALMSQLSELLLVETLRRYCETEVAPSGWLGGMKDPQIGRALAMLHGNLAHPWSVESLASRLSMSRSAFVARFSTAVGLPPIRYLARARLAAAKLLLRETSLTTNEVAHRVGYDAPVAFNRAFKRAFKLPPAAWRHRDRGRPNSGNTRTGP